MDAQKGAAGRPLADVALIALVGLTLDSLGSALAWLSGAAFERYSRVVDGSGLAATVQFSICFGPAVWLLLNDCYRLQRSSALVSWHRRGWVLLDCFAVAQVTAYFLLLRLPWVAEQAVARNRVDVWSARLSETSRGVPLTAFLLAVGFGTLFIAVCAATLRAIDDLGFMQNQRIAMRFTAAVLLVCGADCTLAMLTLITFATGGVF